MKGMTKMRHVMVDLETTGYRPGCGLLSIGAVFFDPAKQELGAEFYCVVNRASCIDAGMHEDESTLQWWNKQSEAARKVMHDATKKEASKIASALLAFNSFLLKGEEPKVWGNGADFDNAILAFAYGVTGVKPGWKGYNGRCYRTLKNMAPSVKLVRVGTYHNALDDAKTQAKHALALFKELRILDV